MSYHDILGALNEDFLRNVPYVDISKEEYGDYNGNKVNTNGNVNGNSSSINNSSSGSVASSKKGKGVGGGGNGNGELAELFSWHDALRKHTADMPAIPRPSELDEKYTSHKQQHGSGANLKGHVQVGGGTKNYQRADDGSSSETSVEKKKKELQRIKFENLVANKESFNLANLCKHGWNLSKGLQNKPNTHKQADISVVQRDIELFASKVNRKVCVQYPDRFPSLSDDSHKRYEGEDLVLASDAEATKIQAQVKLTLNGANPGSRYDIRQFGEKSGNNNNNSRNVGGSTPHSHSSSQSNSLLLLSNSNSNSSFPHSNFLRRQRSETLARDFSFSKVDRFRSQDADAYLSPGPIYYPTTGTISQDLEYESGERGEEEEGEFGVIADAKDGAKSSRRRKGRRRFPCLLGNGREFFGSIYMDVYNTVSPGPKYSTLEPYKKLSHCPGLGGLKIGRGFEGAGSRDNRDNKG